jgi:hypothetical protein
MADEIWRFTKGDKALIATAIHDGHASRPEVAALFALPENERLREEDPYTGGWTAVAGTRIVGLRSRFEVDLNRPRAKCVYRKPEDAWGLHVWKEELPQEIVDRSLAEYDAFYDEVRRIYSEAAKQHGRFVVFDLHTYNHRRGGPGSEPAPAAENPEVNLGTGTMDRTRWAPVVDRFIHDLRAFDYGGRQLDVRENVKFRGGQLSRWTHENFPGAACSLAVEFKKFFMDEWSGEIDQKQNALILAALRSTVPGVLEELGNRRPA